MSARDFLETHNRWSIPWAEVPLLPVEGLHAEVAGAIAAGARLAAYFGLPEEAERTRLVCVLAEDSRGLLRVGSADVGQSFPALTPACPSAHAFEREIAEQCGTIPQGHPWLKPLRRHSPDQLPSGRSAPPFDRDAYPFFEIEGAQVHEVAVGPVHAGIIEPGHFRFQAQGEEVLFLEIVLGYQHRGVERLLASLPPARSVLVAEAIAGDTAVGHAEAHCAALEALARSRKSPRAQTLRGIALELERLANHLGDLGAIAGDIAYAPGAAVFGRLRGDCLNLLLELSGNRLGKGLVRPGGVGFDMPTAMANRFIGKLEALRAEFSGAGSRFFDAESVRARLEGVGIVSPEACEALACVGPTARACGVGRDVRQDHAYGVFRFAQVPISTAWAGDVSARAYVRRLEIGRSVDFLLEQLRRLPKGDVLADFGSLRRSELSIAMTEGWRGEIVHVVLTDAEGRVRRHKVIDPSFHNWSALAAAMPGNLISDFPVCNKSFNLSYAGHDL